MNKGEHMYQAKRIYSVLFSIILAWSLVGCLGAVEEGNTGDNHCTDFIESEQFGISHEEALEEGNFEEDKLNQSSDDIQMFDSLHIDIVIRDFSSNHPDFENFNMKNPTPGLEDCGYIGQSEISTEAQRQTIFSVLRDNYPNKYFWATSSSREVFPTFGMIQSSLGTDGKPVKARSACNNSQFEQWFNDVPGVNYRVEDVLSLPNNRSGAYQVDYSYWNIPRNSYFPLDKHASSQVGSSISPLSPAINTWGKQGHDRWCNSDQLSCQVEADLNGTTVNTFGDSNIESHNYGFTVHGQFEFRYSKQRDEFFSIIGNDDIWIFIDGQLVTDMGGTHLPTQSTLSMNLLAVENNWTDSTLHRLDFFIAERQTDDSELKITTNLMEINPQGSLSPLLTRAEFQPGSDEMILFTNIALSEESLGWIRSNNSLLKDDEENPLYIDSIEPTEVDDDERLLGFKYVLKLKDFVDAKQVALLESSFIEGDNGRAVDKTHWVNLVSVGCQ